MLFKQNLKMFKYQYMINNLKIKFKNKIMKLNRNKKVD